MVETSFLDQVRRWLANPMFVFFFGSVCFVSQLALYAIVKDIGAGEIIKLQLAGFKASYYLAVFADWKANGLMDNYAAHFLFDDIHWLWYTLFLTGLLSCLMEKCNTDNEFNFILLLPLAAGLCDAFENTMQHIFLMPENYPMLYDPLPMLSTFASLGKWLLILFVLVLVFVLMIRARVEKNH